MFLPNCLRNGSCRPSLGLDAVAAEDLPGPQEAHVVMRLERGRVALGRINGTTGTRMAWAVPLDDATVKPLADKRRGAVQAVL